MTARIFDGAGLASQVRAEVGVRAAALRAGGVVPTLAVVLVGDDPASQVYVNAKTKAAREAGVEPIDHRLPATTTEAALLSLIAQLNADDRVDGILIQLPLPKPLAADVIIRALDPAKDVDGLHPENLGLLAQGQPRFVPCTPRGCMRILAAADVPLTGARAVVLGRSVLVGKPVALLLAAANATVTLCHSQTRDLADEIGRADVVIAAIGRPRMVLGGWLKPGAAVIDVGINRLPAGGLVGDVDAETASARAGLLTPVPRGVGPMTIACLLENTVDAAVRRRGRA